MNSLRQIILTAAKSGIGVNFVSKDGRTHTHRTWASILEMARRRAGALAQDDIMPSDRVIVMGNTDSALVETLVAINLRGAIPVILAPPRPNARDHQDFVVSVFKDLNAKRVLIGDPYFTKNRTLVDRLAGRARKLKENELNLLKGADAPESQYAFLQYSSGSTQAPRGVQITQAGLVANLDAIKADAQPRENDVVVSWLPLYHDMGLIAGLLGPPAWNMPSTLMDPMTFIRRPSRWLKSMSEFGGTISMAPNFAYEYCLRFIKPHEIQDLDLSTWRLSWNGAEMVLASTIKNFEAAYEPCGLQKNIIVPSYGAAEATLKISSRSPNQPLLIISLARDSLAHGVARVSRSGQDSLTVVSVGRPSGDMSVRIVDEEHTTLPDWQIGEIEISGASVAQGYYGIDDSNFSSHGQFLTGDLGFIVDGELFVTGRRKDLIVVDGRNIYPFDLEWTTTDILRQSCRQVAAFSQPDRSSGSERIVVAVESTPRKRPTLDEYRKLEQRLVATAGTTKIEIVEMNRVPLTSSGKVQRQRAKELYASGLYSVPWIEEEEEVA